MRKLLSKFPKWLVFSLAGLMGAGVLSASYEVVVRLFFLENEAASFAGRILGTGVWFSFPVTGVIILIFICQQALLGNENAFSILGKPLLSGLALGFISGAVAEFLFQFAQVAIARGSRGGGAELLIESVRVLAWSIAGGGLGLTLSRSVPNLAPVRACIFGFAGGFIGAIGFLAVSYVAGDVSGRIVGTGTIGFFVGLSVVIAEATATEGFLRVIWGPGEFTRVNLGPRPITVGSSSESTVRMPPSAGYPPIVATFSLQNGRATMVNHMSRTTHSLRSGNKLTLGRVVIEVHLFS